MLDRSTLEYWKEEAEKWKAMWREERIANLNHEISEGTDPETIKKAYRELKELGVE